MQPPNRRTTSTTPTTSVTSEAPSSTEPPEVSAHLIPPSCSSAKPIVIFTEVTIVQSEAPPSPTSSIPPNSSTPTPQGIPPLADLPVLAPTPLSAVTASNESIPMRPAPPPSTSGGSFLVLTASFLTNTRSRFKRVPATQPPPVTQPPLKKVRSGTTSSSPPPTSTKAEVP